MKSKHRLLMILTLIAFQLAIPQQCFAISESVNESTFLETVPFTEFDSGKSDSFYKISVDKKAKKILLQLSICDYSFGNLSPEITAIFDNGDGEQIALTSTSTKSEGIDFSSISNFKYFNKSKTALYNIEISFLSTLYYNVSIDCNVLGVTHKVSPAVEIDFTPPPTTQKETTLKSTTTKTNNTEQTEKSTTLKEQTTKPANSNSVSATKSSTKSTLSNTRRADDNGDYESDLTIDTDFPKDKPSSENVTNVEAAKLNKKAKFSIALAGGIGAFSIVAIICAILENNKMAKRTILSDKTKTDIESDKTNTN